MTKVNTADMESYLKATYKAMSDKEAGDIAKKDRRNPLQIAR